MKKCFGKILCMASLFFLLACTSIGQKKFSEADANTDRLRIYLVRHAEKTKTTRDPELTTAGLNRAQQLAEYLSNEAVSSIYSSNYTRTRQTAKPTAELFDLDLNLYDPRDLPAFAEKLKTGSGTSLVVGHSNTTPQLVELLGGDPVSVINEAKEYDRLYLLIIKTDGSVQSQLMRYGQKFEL